MCENWYDEKNYECRDCGDREGRNPISGECKNHDNWVYCKECGAIWPTVSPFFSPGTPDVFYLPNGDPGYPGDLPEFECPSCYSNECPFQLDDIDMLKDFEPIARLLYTILHSL